MKHILFFATIFSIALNSLAQTVTTVAGGNGIGSGANQLAAPMGVFLDASGNLYVADKYNNRVQKFPAGSTSATNGVTVAGGNGIGNTPNQLTVPWAVWVDANDNVIVADRDNRRIQKFPAGSNSTTNGVTIAGGNGTGLSLNQLELPTGIFLDANSNLYVADPGNNRILKFPAGSDSTTNGVQVAGDYSIGSAPNALQDPQGVFLDDSGYIYVADSYNDRIQRFPIGSMANDNATTMDIGGVSGDAQESIVSVFIGPDGSMYFVDQYENRILKYPPGNTNLNAPKIVVGGGGTAGADDQLAAPYGIFVDSNGDVYVADTGNNRVRKYSGGASGLTNISNPSSLSIFPNPCNGTFVLRSSNNIGKQFVITDLTGRVLMQQFITGNEQQLNLCAAAGVYLLSIKGGEEKTIRFTVTR